MDINSMIIKKILFPLMEYFKGNCIRDNVCYLKQTQYLSSEEIINLQKNKLTKLLNHCIETVPAYNSLKFLKEEINDNPFKAIKQFPLLDKQFFRKHSNEYISSKSQKKMLIENRTGGSTGEPLKFFIDRYTVEFYEAARYRGLSWWDIDIGDRCVMVWGSPVELNQIQSFKFRVKERFLKNRIIIPAYDLNPMSVDKYTEMINKFKPVYLYGYASSLYCLAKLMIQDNKSLKYTPKAVVSTAETLHSYQRETIEKAFGCKSVNEYGARDAGILAYECKNGNMHICSENVFLEVVDVNTKQPLSLEDHSSGLVVVTDLNNFSMPRIRYILGDIVELSNDICKCGLNLPIIKQIQGREDDIFISSDGSFVHGHYFNHIVRNLEGIKQFQIIQHDRTSLTLNVVKDHNFNDDVKESLRNEIINKMGNVNLKINYVEDIPPSSSGKIRYAIREFRI